jgi:hypothetical protein
MPAWKWWHHANRLAPSSSREETKTQKDRADRVQVDSFSRSRCLHGSGPLDRHHTIRLVPYRLCEETEMLSDRAARQDLHSSSRCPHGASPLDRHLVPSSSLHENETPTNRADRDQDDSIIAREELHMEAVHWTGTTPIVSSHPDYVRKPKC